MSTTKVAPVILPTTTLNHSLHSIDVERDVKS